jgi:hypothetical protein
MTKPCKFPRLIATQPVTPIPELPFPKVSVTIPFSSLNLGAPNPRNGGTSVVQLIASMRRIGVLPHKPTGSRSITTSRRISNVRPNRKIA